MISVIFVTNRKGALEILHENLKRQTFKNFEVIIADDLHDERSYPEADYTVKHFKPRLKKDGDAWNLNKAYNDCLVRVQGELIVFLQDFIWIPSNGLERFWEIYELYPNDLVTGVGHKAKIGLEGISETDERVFGDMGISPGNESHYEFNWSSCPTSKSVYLDEDMDKNYGGENQVFALGVQKKFNNKIWIDRSNRCIGYSQEQCGGRPDDWEERHSNKGVLAQKISQLMK